MQSCYHDDNPKRNGSFRKPCFDKAISLPVATFSFKVFFQHETQVVFHTISQVWLLFLSPSCGFLLHRYEIWTLEPSLVVQWLGCHVSL